MCHYISGADICHLRFRMYFKETMKTTLRNDRGLGSLLIKSLPIQHCDEYVYELLMFNLNKMTKILILLIFVKGAIQFVLSIRCKENYHYCDVILGAMVSQIPSLAIVYSTVHSGADQRKHQNSASLAVVRGSHRWPVNSPHKWPVTWKMFSFDDVMINEEMYKTYMTTLNNPHPPTLRLHVGSPTSAYLRTTT